MLPTDPVRAARIAALRARRMDDPVAAARRASLIAQRGVTAARQRVSVSRSAHRCSSAKLLFVAKAAEAKIDGDNLTFPVVAFVEGIRQPANSGGPELFLKSEFEPALPSAIGMPVVFNHPQVTDPVWGDVWYVPVNYSEPFDAGTGVFLGQVDDGRFEDDRMILDVTVSFSRFAMAGAEARLAGQTIVEGGQLEVSLGHFSNVLPIGGFWNGQPYFGVHTDVEFDHLALLPVGVEGACDASAGCGAPRA